MLDVALAIEERCDYWEVDDSMIYANLQSHLSDFAAYISYIVRLFGPMSGVANEEENA